MNKNENKEFYDNICRQTMRIKDHIETLESYCQSLEHVGLSELANNIEASTESIDRHARSIEMIVKNYLAFGE